MKSESWFKSRLVTLARDRGAWARRHEDRYAIGLLDMEIKFPGRPHLMAEGKLIKHQAFAPTLSQFYEGERYRAAGGIAALIGWDPNSEQMYIHDWTKTGKRGTAWTAPDMEDAAALETWLATW
jgi:hypothetical protein